MLTLIISLLISIALVVTGLVTHQGGGASTGYGIVGLLASQFLIGFFVRKKVGVVNNELQSLILEGQKRISRKVNMFQSKPGGNIKTIQRTIERDQKEIYTQALDFTKNLVPFKRWNLLMEKQIATMHLQFLYQLKEFEKVDEILARGMMASPMLMEPMAVAMKMARQYKNKEFDAAEKTFNRRVKWFRGDRGTMLYALMSWIYMKQGESEKARQLLLKGKESTGNEVLARNWEVLSNNKDKQFSNAGLGDEWFALYLENPPTPKQQRMRGNAQSGRRF